MAKRVAEIYWVLVSSIYMGVDDRKLELWYAYMSSVLIRSPSISNKQARIGGKL